MTKLKITCTDGYLLDALIFKPTKIKAAVMICPATGIKKEFYTSFAKFLMENEYGVICFDNRGIGRSLYGSIKKSDASLLDWGQLDMPAVLVALKENFPNTTYHLIGHSAGGQLLGLMHNAREIKSMFNFGSSSGSIRNMRMPFKIQAHFFLNVFIPINNLILGYTNTHWVGMGEPLPRKVGQQWSKWCNGQGYAETEFGNEIHNHLYHEIDIASQWLYATDDEIANLTNVKDMIRVYSKIKSEIVIISPKDNGLKEIGHMKFFSSKSKILWKYALDWLDKNH